MQHTNPAKAMIPSLNRSPPKGKNTSYKELKKVYGHFEMLKKNGENGVSKVTYSSLDKYNKSPYLQKITIQSNRRPPNRQNTPSNRALNSPLNALAELRLESEEKQKMEHTEEKSKQMNHVELPKLTTPMKFKEGDVINYFKTELEAIENPLSKGKSSIGTHSATLEVSSKTSKLQPLHKLKIHYAARTKAGTNGKQQKVNQDMAIIDVKLPFGLKLFSVCDGHGVNGHLVSAFIKAQFLQNLNRALSRLTIAPTLPELKNQIVAQLFKTNQDLLNSEINTELSGSTVVMVFIYNTKIICFNVGDSRAILIKQVPTATQTEKIEPLKEVECENSETSFIDFKFNNRMVHHQWQVVALSSDQKPQRPDERERILKFGGRIFSQKNEKGQDLGPLRVWMKDAPMPGLAMTRSFGDKAGVKAGTTGEPQITEFDLGSEQKFIVVASDGIWQYLENEQIMTLMIPFYQRGELDFAAERLVKVASEIWHKVSYSRDDITVIVVSLSTLTK